MGSLAAILPGGKLHLQHGPIDLIIGADGQRDRAFEAAQARFATILSELAGELSSLRQRFTPDCAAPETSVALRMDDACRPFAGETFVTRMAAVAGSVADEVLSAMTAETELERAYVNNGGDIALHLTKGTSFRTEMQDHAGRPLGRIEITHQDPVRGIATSGRHGRSHSLGIADSVTVLARTAASADVAATLIANAVDLPDHPGIARRSACELHDDSDLGTRLVVTGCPALARTDRKKALTHGVAQAENYRAQYRIIAASLHLQGEAAATKDAPALIKEPAHV